MWKVKKMEERKITSFVILKERIELGEFKQAICTV